MSFLRQTQHTQRRLRAHGVWQQTRQRQGGVVKVAGDALEEVTERRYRPLPTGARRPQQPRSTPAAPAEPAAAPEVPREGWEAWSGPGGRGWARDGALEGADAQEWAGWEGSNASAWDGAPSSSGPQEYRPEGYELPSELAGGAPSSAVQAYRPEDWKWQEGAADAEVLEPRAPETELVPEHPDAEAEDMGDDELPELPALEGPGRPLIDELQQFRDRWAQLRGWHDEYPRTFDDFATAAALAIERQQGADISMAVMEEVLLDLFTVDPDEPRRTITYLEKHWYAAFGRALARKHSHPTAISKEQKRRVLIRNLPIIFSVDDVVELRRPPILYHPWLAQCLVPVLETLLREASGLPVTERVLQLCLRFFARHEWRLALNMMQEGQYQRAAQEPYTLNLVLYHAANVLSIRNTPAAVVQQFMKGNATALLTQNAGAPLHAATLEWLLSMLSMQQRNMFFRHHTQASYERRKFTRRKIRLIREAVRRDPFSEPLTLSPRGWAYLLETVLEFAGPRDALQLCTNLNTRMRDEFGPTLDAHSAFEHGKAPVLVPYTRKEGLRMPLLTEDAARHYPTFGSIFEFTKRAEFQYDYVNKNPSLLEESKEFIDLRRVWLPPHRVNEIHHAALKALSLMPRHKAELFDAYRDYIAYCEARPVLRIPFRPNHAGQIGVPGMLPMGGTDAMCEWHIRHASWAETHAFLIEYVIQKEQYLKIDLLNQLAQKAFKEIKTERAPDARRLTANAAVADLLHIFAVDIRPVRGSTQINSFGDIVDINKGWRSLMKLASLTDRAALMSELYTAFIGLVRMSSYAMDKFIVDDEEVPDLLTPRDLECVLRVCSAEGEWRAAERAHSATYLNERFFQVGDAAAALRRIPHHMLLSHVRDPVPEGDARSLRVLELTLQAVLQGAVLPPNTLRKSLDFLTHRVFENGGDLSLPIQRVREKSRKRQQFQPLGITPVDTTILMDKWLMIPGNTGMYLDSPEEEASKLLPAMTQMQEERANVIGRRKVLPTEWREKSMRASDMVAQFAPLTMKQKKFQNPMVFSLAKAYCALGDRKGFIAAVIPHKRRFNQQQAIFLDALLEVSDKLGIAAAAGALLGNRPDRKPEAYSFDQALARLQDLRATLPDRLPQEVSATGA